MMLIRLWMNFTREYVEDIILGRWLLINYWELVLYWPTIFYNVYREVASYQECQIFYGKTKLMHLPLNPISVEEPFQQWGLDFIREINPNYLGKNRCILTSINYFTKWNEAIPTRRATDVVIMNFLEENILAIFGCPRRICDK